MTKNNIILLLIISILIALCFIGCHIDDEPESYVSCCQFVERSDDHEVSYEWKKTTECRIEDPDSSTFIVEDKYCD